ncbi:unnamed protein product [Dibothriocephalus latus]|uniref:Uncharacterized protein n=1 Tax=Dibothriocephalus latus TaxID=60516 RepID=A0A3P7NA13_DIBLA|nr:unnamed protein product [Dibothriocephalus latus]
MATLAVRGSENLEVGGRTLRVQFWKAMKKAKLRKGNDSANGHGGGRFGSKAPRRESAPEAHKPFIVVPSNLRGGERTKYIQRLLLKRKKKAAKSATSKADRPKGPVKKNKKKLDYKNKKVPA